MQPDRRKLLISTVFDYLGNIGAEELANILEQPKDAEHLAKQLREIVAERREAAARRYQDFKNHLNNASVTVSEWPLWKQHVLGSMSGEES